MVGQKEKIMFKVDFKQGYGSPQGSYFIYIRDKTGIYLVGGYPSTEALKIFKRLEQKHGKGNIIVSLNPTLSRNYTKFPYPSRLKTLSAIKQITNFEKNIGSKMMQKNVWR